MAIIIDISYGNGLNNPARSFINKRHPVTEGWYGELSVFYQEITKELAMD
jgi:hypothetical protein